MFKSEIRNSRAQPRRARAAAQSVRTCGAITRGRSRQHAVGARLAERASAARSRRSASTTLAAPCMQPRSLHANILALERALARRTPAAAAAGAAAEKLKLRSATSAAAKATEQKDYQRHMRQQLRPACSSLLAKRACCCERRQPQQQPHLQHIMICGGGQAGGSCPDP